MSVPATIAEQLAVSALIGGSGTNANRSKFWTTYEKNAIYLFGGIAGSSYSNSIAISTIAGGLDLTFVPLSGGSLGPNQVATYPFANQGIAANAVIAQPLTISVKMIAPANPATSQGIGYLSKVNAMTALATSLRLHDNLGGLYSIWTPAYIYSNCLRLDMVDISDGSAQQTQFQWRLDFYQPLITLQQAAQAQSSLMNALTQGIPNNGSWSGQNTANQGGGQVNSNVSLTAPSSLQ